MPFHKTITKFALAEQHATLLRIHPRDPWLGLAQFGNSETPQWINAGYLAACGWRPVV